MLVKELVALAKKGDKKAFDELVKYYEEYFANMVVKKNNNESLRNKAKEELPGLLKIYVERDYIHPVHDYLSYYAVRHFGEKIKISDTRKMELEKVKEIYSERLIKEFKEINTVLTDEELNSYAYNLVSDTIDAFAEDRDTLTSKLGVFFARQRQFVNNQEVLLIRYILQEGNNSNITNYFIDKYKYLLEEYKEETSYKHLCDNFENIVIKILNSLKSNKKTFKCTLEKILHKIHLEYLKDIQNVCLNIRTDDKRRQELYEANLVLKDRVYNSYGKNVNLPEEKIKELIDEKYDSYFNAYINGVCTKTLSQYILTRFSEYFKKTKFPRDLTNEEAEEKLLTYYMNEDCIDKKLKKTGLNHPRKIVYEELREAYDIAIEDFYRKENKSNIRILIAYRLDKKIDELRVLYSDSVIMRSSRKMKSAIILNKLQNEEIVNEIIDNLTEYYISNKMENEKPFELFIIDTVESFDMEEYLMIKAAKEQMNLKVLRHPRIK